MKNKLNLAIKSLWQMQNLLKAHSLKKWSDRLLFNNNKRTVAIKKNEPATRTRSTFAFIFNC